MTAMRLAEATGHPDADAMLDGLSPKAFAEWVAKDRIEPIGTNGVCLILAKIGELIAWAAGSPAKQRDFMPWLPDEKPPELSRADSRAALLSEVRRAAGGA